MTARPSLTVVGSGILGLSVAWHFACRASLFRSIQVLQGFSPWAGSQAAPALLTTHGQQRPRQPHFALKLLGKQQYPTWLGELSGLSSTELAPYFRVGEGVDHFSTSEQCQRHETRVRETLEGPLTPQQIFRVSPTSLVYKNEMWVNAAWLLKLLEVRLKERNVSFIQQMLDRDFFDTSLNVLHAQNTIVLCTGAWTKSLVGNLGLTLPTGLRKQKERLSWGTTYFHAAAPSVEGFGSFAEQSSTVGESSFIFETWHASAASPVTWSSGLQTCSGASQPVENFDSLLQMAQTHPLSATQKLGLRVGYGNQGLCIEEISDPRLKNRVMVCAGAHRSGFLLAPLVGSLVEELLQQK